MKQRPVRKLLALVLSLLLVFAFTPAALADGAVAKIGTIEYNTVQAAVEAVAKGDASGTIDMVADSTEDVTIPRRDHHPQHRRGCHPDQRQWSHHYKQWNSEHHRQWYGG